MTCGRGRRRPHRAAEAGPDPGRLRSVPAAAAGRDSTDRRSCASRHPGGSHRLPASTGSPTWSISCGSDERQLAAESKQEADRDYRTSQLVLGAGVAVSMLLGLLVALLLSRDMVPRIRRYAQFATRVAAGQSNDVLRTSGRDELADSAGPSTPWWSSASCAHGQDLSQTEFVDTLQVSCHRGGSPRADQAPPASDRCRTAPPRSCSATTAPTSCVRRPPSPRTATLADRLVGAEPRSCLSAPLRPDPPGRARAPAAAELRAVRGPRRQLAPASRCSSVGR